MDDTEFQYCSVWIRGAYYPEHRYVPLIKTTCVEQQRHLPRTQESCVCLSDKFLSCPSSVCWRENKLKRGCKIYAICKSIMLIPFWDYFALNLTSPGGMQKAWNQECKLLERDSNVVWHYYSFCFISKIVPGRLVLIFLHFSQYIPFVDNKMFQQY